MNELIPFQLPSGAAADSSVLRAFLACQLAYERARKTRENLVHVLMAVGILPWTAFLWPQALPEGLVEVALACWAILLVAVLTTASLEWTWHRRRDDRLSRLRRPLCPGDLVEHG